MMKKAKTAPIPRHITGRPAHLPPSPSVLEVVTAQMEERDAAIELLARRVAELEGRANTLVGLLSSLERRVTAIS